MTDRVIPRPAAAPALRPLSAADESWLQELYSDTSGPSLAFLLTLSGQATSRAWRLLVAEQAVGAVWFRHIDTEVELIDMRIDTAHRNRGFGSLMLRQALQVLAKSGARVCYLEVRQSNTVAQRLYRQLGFEQSGCRRHYYSAGAQREDGILMTLKLEKMIAV